MILYAVVLKRKCSSINKSNKMAKHLPEIEGDSGWIEDSRIESSGDFGVYEEGRKGVTTALGTSEQLNQGILQSNHINQKSNICLH